MLTVDHVSVCYGKSRAVCGVSFSVEDGGRLAVLGRNGVGKTTLLKSIVGLLPLSGGKIVFDGRDLSGLRPCFRCRMGIAYVPQGREILPKFTVRENLELGCLGIRDHRSVELRTEKMLGYFPILSEHLERRGGVLSGGQQQQLAIARALMTSPRLLLLDEPTEGIQPNMVEDLGRILDRICREMPLSVVLVEQNLNFAKRMTSDYIILQKGEVCAAGKTAELGETVVKQFLSV